MHKLGFLKAVIIVSLTSVIVFSAYAVFVLSPLFVDLITRNIESEAVRVATHLSNMIVKPGSVGDVAVAKPTKIAKETLPSDLVVSMKKAEKDFGLMKVKLYSQSGETVYSSDLEDIGKINKNSYFHDTVAKGRTYTKVVKKNTRSLEDQVITKDVVETYIPIMRKNIFLGAFEIYFDISSTKEKLDRLLLRSHFTSVVLALGILAVVILISIKAIKNIVMQFAAKAKDIEDAHKRLLTVLDSLDAGVYVADMETYEVLFVNKYLRDDFGDAVGKVCWEVFHPKSSGPCDFCTNQKLLASDGSPVGVNVWEFENILAEKWYEIRDRAIRWVDGRIVRLEIAADITDRKHTEMELRKAYHEMGTFCQIIKNISKQQTLDDVGNFLMQELQDILNTRYMFFYVFSGDRSTIFTIRQGESTTIKEPKQIRKISDIFKRLDEVTISPKIIFEPPLIPEYFPPDGQQIVIPLQIKNPSAGGLVVACREENFFDKNKIGLVALILEQASGTIKRAVLHHEEILKLESRIEKTSEFSGMIGKDPKMQEIYKRIDDIAPTDATVLIQGDTGTGKEMAARAIYHRSQRKTKPFVVINCSAYPDTLLESELFGHIKGAFTDAVFKKVGRFEQADGGTVFLDEIGEISLSAQIKLLRILQTRQLERLGDEQTLTVDVRIIAATNKNLLEEIEKGNFREDLYYRLNVIPIHLPPLNLRKNDIPLLAHHFQAKFASQHDVPVMDFSTEAMRRLLDYSWPGNVRELENSIEHAVLLSRGRRIEVLHLPSDMILGIPSMLIAPVVRHGTIIDNEKRLLINALEECNWNKSKAALQLGISRQTLYDKLKRYRITRITTH